MSAEAITQPMSFPDAAVPVISPRHAEPAEYPNERGTQVAFHIANAMSGMSEAHRTRPLDEVLAEDGYMYQIGMTTYTAMLEIAAELGTFTPDVRPSRKRHRRVA
jgi:hypothetical protein